MGYKPADFFVGVMDFFTVLLPGAILLAIVQQPVFELRLIRPAVPSAADGALGWIAFLVGAYLTGHVLFLFGALLDSPLYDPLRRWVVPREKDKTYLRARAVRDAVLSAKAGEAINAFQWARATLQLRAPAAFTEVERYEADSKFFRSLAVTVYALLLIVLGADVRLSGAPPLVSRLSVAALVVTVLLAVWIFGSMLVREHRVRDEARRAEKEKRPPGDLPELRWFRRVLALIPALLFVVLAWRLLAAIQLWERTALPLVLLALLALVVWRYAERRWKSTRAAYQYVIVLHEQVSPVAGAVSGGGAPAGGFAGAWPIGPVGAAPPANVGVPWRVVAPVPEAGAIAVRGVGGELRVLLVRARQDPSDWIFPKGHIEPGERPDEAALRELFEEAGYRGRVVAPVGESEFASGGAVVRVEYFLVDVPAGAQPADGEGRECRWCAPEEALRLLRFDDARERLRRAVDLAMASRAERRG